VTHQQAADIPMLRIPRSAHPVPTTPRLRSAHVAIWAYVVLIVAVFAGSILVGRSPGWFDDWSRHHVAGRRRGRLTRRTGNRCGPGRRVRGAGGAHGWAVPEDVKGWMTLQQVLYAFPMTQAALYQRFGIPADTPTATTLSSLKEAGDLSGFDVPTLRTWLSEQARE
jgi:hypothetical protein